MEVNNEMIKQISSSALWSELSLRSSCGSDCTASIVFTHLLLHILPLKVVVGAIAFENNVDFFFFVPCCCATKYNCSQHRLKKNNKIQCQVKKNGVCLIKIVSLGAWWIDSSD